MKVIYLTALIVASCIVGARGTAQTRFEIPDTVPDYSAYKYMDECLTAVVRLNNRADIKDTIWRDTLAEDVRMKQRPVAPAAIEQGRSCLHKVNVDTVRASGQEFSLWGRVLLMVGRDDDVKRIIFRTLDSAKNADEWNQIYGSAEVLYSQARPIRIDGLKNLIELSSPFETAKEAHIRKLSMHVQVAISALALGDTILPRQVVNEVLNEFATKDIEKSLLKQRSLLAEQAFPLAADVLLDQAMDSLKISTNAYRRFVEQLWFKFTDDPFLKSREMIGEKPPVITGKFWYRNEWKIDANGQIQISPQVTQIDPQLVPIPGKVNAIVLLHGGCHALAPRSSRPFGRKVPGGNCWGTASLIKRLKREFPKLEVTVVTKTFGSFGDGLPVTVDEEAKMLSNYMLGFFQIPAMQAISETEFVRIPGEDRRRLDIPVAFENDYQGIYTGDILLVDEGGQVFHNVTLMPSLGRMELTIRKKLQAVFSRTPL